MTYDMCDAVQLESAIYLFTCMCTYSEISCSNLHVYGVIHYIVLLTCMCTY